MMFKCRSDHIVIESENFVDLTIPFQRIPVMPQTPFQVMEGRVVSNVFSIASNSGMRPNTANHYFL